MPAILYNFPANHAASKSNRILFRLDSVDAVIFNDFAVGGGFEETRLNVNNNNILLYKVNIRKVRGKNGTEWLY